TADGSDLDLSFVPNQITESTKSLDFSFNYLLALYNSTFQRLKNLVSLDLTRCGIVIMYKNIFQHQSDLETLILWDSHPFSATPHLHNLDCSHIKYSLGT
ncbi:hypothetical protein P4O66_016418, partial [Electrophorus voltai]